MKKESIAYTMVKKRSHSQCEAVVVNEQQSVEYRCQEEATDVHHMLTRARGGMILDNAGETAHLLHLCRKHHNYAHGKDGAESGLMIDGYVTSGQDGSPVYTGTDPILLDKYGDWRDRSPVDMPGVRKNVSSDSPGQGM